MDVATNIAYIPNFVDDPTGVMLDVLEQVSFIQRTVHMYGKTHTVPRKEAWYGSVGYRFSGHTFPPQDAPAVIDTLATRVAARLGAWYPSTGALVNLYANGRDSVGWHSDDDHGAPKMIVASISLGAGRDMLLRRKNPTGAGPNRVRVHLEPGSLLIMGVGVQDEWEHSIPKRSDRVGTRVNITFRGSSK